MPLLQIHIDEKLKKRIQKEAKHYNVPMSTLVRIKLVDVFEIEENDDENYTPGNIFNAKRDNNGEGIPMEEFLEMIDRADRTEK